MPSWPPTAMIRATIPNFWDRAHLVFPQQGACHSSPRTADVLNWFRRQGRGYQARINAVLRRHFEHSRNPGRGLRPFCPIALSALLATATPRARLPTTSTSAWSGSTCRFQCRWRSTASAAGSARCSATTTCTAPRACASTPGRRQSRPAGRPGYRAGAQFKVPTNTLPTVSGGSF